VNSAENNATFADREQLVIATRQLIDESMVMMVADERVVARATSLIDQATELLAEQRALGGGRTSEYRSHDEYLPRSPVVGTLSPIAPGTFKWSLSVDDSCPERLQCTAVGSMRAAYEGPPAHVHGGMIALIFDEVLGIINIANNCPGMTGKLEVRYRRPTPLFVELRCVARIDRIEGRRVHSHAELWNGETLCAEANALFIQPKSFPTPIDAHDHRSLLG